VSDDWFDEAVNELENESKSDDDKADTKEASTSSQPATDEQADRTQSPESSPSTDEFGFDGNTASSAGETNTPSDSSDDPFGFGKRNAGTQSGGQTGPQTGQSGGDEFGFGGFGGGDDQSTPSAEDFDDEDFESDIDRINLGIKGLDEMILGGVPERSLIGIIGGAGTGKTTFGLQFLNEALINGDRAVFITLEQTREAVLSTAEEKGWPFRQYADDGQLSVVVLDPVEMANSLASIRGDISRLIREFGAERLVLDSVSLLEMMYDHPARRRSEVFDFTRSLKEAGVTTLLTSEASEDSSHASRYGAVEYLTDAVFILQYVRTSNFEETRLAVEIQKIRDANHSRATKPYDLTDEGMSVHRQANIF
jgi:KaiC domain protein